MENLLTIVIAVLGSSWIGGLIKDWAEDRRKKKRPRDRMILAMGRRQLLEDAKGYIAAGGIPEDEFDVFDAEFKAYIAMGGNSKVKKLCEEALKLPLISEE